MAEAMFRTIKNVREGERPYKVITHITEPSEAQQAVLSWLAAQQDALATDRKIGLTNYLRLAAVGLPVLMWHIEEARLRSSGPTVPKTRAAQEDWLRRMDIPVDPKASAMEHR